MNTTRLLALSGSLRKHSYNTLALQILRSIAPDGVSIEIGEIDKLPLFNPDLEETHIQSVANLKHRLSLCNGLILASPEYAHGISGAMKNALDWLVSGAEFPGKKIMLINTAPRASHAIESLKEVLTTMSGEIVESACVAVPLLGSAIDSKSLALESSILTPLQTGLNEFVRQLKEQ